MSEEFPKNVPARDIVLHDAIMTPPGYGDPVGDPIEHTVLAIRPTLNGVELLVVPSIEGTGDRIYLGNNASVTVVRRHGDPSDRYPVETRAIGAMTEARVLVEQLGFGLGAVRGGKLRVGDVIMVNGTGDWRVVERVEPGSEAIGFRVWLSNAVPGLRIDEAQPFVCLRKK